MDQPPKQAGPTQWKLEPPAIPKRMPHHSLAAKQASVDDEDSGSDTWRDIEEEIVSLQVRRLIVRFMLAKMLSFWYSTMLWSMVLVV